MHGFIHWYGLAFARQIAPCVLLAVLSALLIRAMTAAAAKRRHLKAQGKRVESERASEHNRTTAMLVSVVLCFVATELPQGVIALLSGLNNRVFEEVYVPLGDVWDILVLVNSAVNFVLYCIMSRQYRLTFDKVFLARFRGAGCGGVGSKEGQMANIVLLPSEPVGYGDRQHKRIVCRLRSSIELS